MLNQPCLISAPNIDLHQELLPRHVILLTSNAIKNKIGLYIESKTLNVVHYQFIILLKKFIASLVIIDNDIVTFKALILIQVIFKITILMGIYLISSNSLLSIPFFLLIYNIIMQLFLKILGTIFFQRQVDDIYEICLLSRQLKDTRIAEMNDRIYKKLLKTGLIMMIELFWSEFLFY